MIAIQYSDQARYSDLGLWPALQCGASFCKLELCNIFCNIHIRSGQLYQGLTVGRLMAVAVIRQPSPIFPSSKGGYAYAMVGCVWEKAEMEPFCSGWVTLIRCLFFFFFFLPLSGQRYMLQSPHTHAPQLEFGRCWLRSYAKKGLLESSAIFFLISMQFHNPMTKIFLDTCADMTIALWLLPRKL